MFKGIRNGLLRGFSTVFGTKPTPPPPTDAENAFGGEGPPVIHASPTPAYTDLSWLSSSTISLDGDVGTDKPVRPPRNPARNAAKTKVMR